jgi:putative ABC transport system ATP-binding protein
MRPVMELRNVRKRYQLGTVRLEALRGVHTRFDEGEMTAIIGASGSGKSTMMHILGCLDRPSDGEYLLDGQNVSSLSDGALSEIRNRKIGFIFQSFNLIPHLTIVENAELPLFYMGKPRAERHRLSNAALERVGLGHRLSHSPSELSGGERQRVAIARAIVHGPRVILADEPTGNLDSKTGEEIMRILHQLHDEGRTLVIVTHDRKIADSLDRRVTVRDGKIVDSRQEAT